jgi:hypothetical protein
MSRSCALFVDEAHVEVDGFIMVPPSAGLSTATPGVLRGVTPTREARGRLILES